MKEILAIFVLCSPLIWELFNDKKGDVHPNNDWLIRGSIMGAASLLVSLFVERNFFQAFVMSFGIFFLLFDYLVNIMYKKPKWWAYVNKTAFPDRIEQWGGSPWYGRLLIKLIIFGAGFSIYFWKEMQIWNYPFGH